MSSSPARKKLRWMCRRGTQELDRITLFYLEEHYDKATTDEQKAFEQLLALSDPELQDILIYGHPHPDDSLDSLATFIRNYYHR